MRHPRAWSVVRMNRQGHEVCMERGVACEQACRDNGRNPDHRCCTWKNAKSCEGNGKGSPARSRMENCVFHIRNRDGVGQNSKGDVGFVAEADGVIGTSLLGQRGPHPQHMCGSGGVQRQCHGIRHQASLPGIVLAVRFRPMSIMDHRSGSNRAWAPGEVRAWRRAQRPSRTLRAASGGGLRPSPTAAARGAPGWCRPGRRNGPQPNQETGLRRAVINGVILSARGTRIGASPPLSALGGAGAGSRSPTGAFPPRAAVRRCAVRRSPP